MNGPTFGAFDDIYCIIRLSLVVLISFELKSYPIPFPFDKSVLCF